MQYPTTTAALSALRHDVAHLAQIAHLSGRPVTERSWRRVVDAVDRRLVAARPVRCDRHMGDGVRCELRNGHPGRCSDTARRAS